MTPAIASADLLALLAAVPLAAVGGELFLKGVLGVSAWLRLPKLLAEINAGRRQLYAQAATQNGVSPTAAGASAFRTVVQGKLRPGDFYQDAGGGWVKK